MSPANPPVRVALGRVLAFGLLGGLVALVSGLVAVSLAPDNGFADLAATAVTHVFLVPLGVLAGAVSDWLTGRS